MKIAIVGSREFRKLHLVAEYVDTLPLDTVVVSGGAVGVDKEAERAARARGLAVQIFPADWPRFGKRAGMLRNAEIVAACDSMVAFWDGKSSGTKDSIARARKIGKPCTVIT